LFYKYFPIDTSDVPAFARYEEDTLFNRFLDYKIIY